MMQAIQVVLDDALLQATDEALLRTKQNRSEFVRDALRERLDRLEALGKEAADRAGYERVPHSVEQFDALDPSLVNRMNAYSVNSNPRNN
jgi:metal-responsive CopG/Arc/MetJ family transcriptional regulator